ncbi:MAG: isoamylase early set domain-containing protein [Acidimicrobiales bacterium]
MIDKQKGKRSKDVKVTFSIPVEWLPRKVSLVGDFNGWDLEANRMRKKGGAWVTSVSLAPGERYRFRYVDELGRWHDDPAADDVVANDHGGVDGIVDLTDPVA